MEIGAFSTDDRGHVRLGFQPRPGEVIVQSSRVALYLGEVTMAYGWLEVQWILLQSDYKKRPNKNEYKDD